MNLAVLSLLSQQKEHERWLRDRRSLVECRHEISRDTSFPSPSSRVTLYRIVSLDETFSIPTVLDASKLFYEIDQVAVVAAIKAVKNQVVTASFDAAVFAAPARVEDILRIEAGVSEWALRV